MSATVHKGSTGPDCSWPLPEVRKFKMHFKSVKKVKQDFCLVVGTNAFKLDHQWSSFFNFQLLPQAGTDVSHVRLRLLWRMAYGV